MAMAGAIGFIALNIGISSLAWRAPERGAPYARPDRVFASPQPLAFWRRDMIWRQDGAIRFGQYDPLRNLTGLFAFGDPLPDHMADPLVRSAAMVTPETRKFLAWSQLPIATIRHQGCKATVTFGDARFTGPALSRNFNVSAVVPDPRCQDPR